MQFLVIPYLACTTKECHLMTDNINIVLEEKVLQRTGEDYLYGMTDAT